MFECPDKNGSQRRSVLGLGLYENLDKISLAEPKQNPHRDHFTKTYLLVGGFQKPCRPPSRLTEPEIALLVSVCFNLNLNLKPTTCQRLSINKASLQVHQKRTFKLS